jgi:hypothetical protein
VKKAAADFMIEATGVQKVYAAGGLRVRAPFNLIPVRDREHRTSAVRGLISRECLRGPSLSSSGPSIVASAGRCAVSCTVLNWPES